jgi:hypothetical protein
VAVIKLLQLKQSEFEYIAVASYVRTNPKPKRELRRFAPQLSFGFYVLTYLAITIFSIEKNI